MNTTTPKQTTVQLRHGEAILKRGETFSAEVGEEYEWIAYSNVNEDTTSDFFAVYLGPSYEVHPKGSPDELMDELVEMGLVEAAVLPSGEPSSDTENWYDHYATDFFFVHESKRDELKRQLFKIWAEVGAFGSRSPEQPDGSEYTKLPNQHETAEMIEIRETDSGHSCILWENQWLYYDPTTLAGESPWRPYEKIDAAELSFGRHPEDNGPARFTLQTREGREGFRDWLRQVLGESKGNWDEESLEGLRFEEYFEPFLFAGYLQNTAEHSEDPIVRPDRRAKEIYREVRDQIVSDGDTAG